VDDSRSVTFSQQHSHENLILEQRQDEGGEGDLADFLVRPGTAMNGAVPEYCKLISRPLQPTA
jgi:hypothetical protein